jgi:hypothetical protein
MTPLHWVGEVRCRHEHEGLLSKSPPSVERADVFGSPDDEAAFARIASLLPACREAIEKVFKAMGLSPQEQRAALAAFVREAEHRAPQIVTVLLLIALLPTVGERALRHFLHQRQESRHDAEELSQGVVLKILGALTGAWPRGNVGAWVATIRDNHYRDHLRGHGRRARAMQRLEQAFHALRD